MSDEQQVILETERVNPASVEIDRMSPLEIATVINAEDAKVALAVQQELPQIAQAIEAIATRLRAGGRLIYIGAGTSGRLAALDAAECPPTFSTSPDMVLACLAGGPIAASKAIEDLEDNADAGRDDLTQVQVGEQDVVVGIAASGRTPYVLGGIRHARQVGALTVGIACNRSMPLAEIVDIMIEPVVGPEVITGSTRLKAGTAQKMVLNMLSTGAMIRLGKTYRNLMVDVQTSNSKLRRRARSIVSQATGHDEATAERLLTESQNETRVAIVMGRTNLSREQASRLVAGHASVRDALDAYGPLE